MTNLLDSIRPFDKQVPLVGALMAAAVLSACGGSDDPAGTLRLGGTVAGLAAGKSVELQNNGAEALRVSEAQGLPPVNAFWVHGAGRLDTPPPSTATVPQVDARLQDAALRGDWPAWAQAWQTLDATALAALAMRLVPLEGSLAQVEKQLQTEKWISELQSVEPVLEFPWQPIRFTVSAQRCVLNHIRQRWQENIIMQM